MLIINLILVTRHVLEIWNYLSKSLKEGFAKPGILFKIKAWTTSKPKHINHIRGFRSRENADIGQKNGFA